MIATEEAGVEGLTEVRELIEKGGPYFTKDCVSSSDLFSVLAYDFPDLELQSTKRNIILKRLGYGLIPNPVKIDGKARRIWVTEMMNNKQIRRLLSKVTG
jgi:hypothetical protein